MFDKNLMRQARQNGAALALTIALGLAAGVFTLLQAYLLTQVIARVFLGEQGLTEVANLLAQLVVIMLVRAGLAWGSEVAGNASALKVKETLRRLLFQRLLELGPAFTRRERTGELTNTAVEGIEALDAYFSQYLPQLALAGLVPLTFLEFVFPLDPLSGLVLLLTAPLIPIFMILIGNIAQALTRRQWKTLGRLSAYFLDVLQGLTTLKTLGRSRGQARVIDQASEQFRLATMNVLRVTFLSAFVLEMVSTLSTAVVAVQVGLRLLYGWLTFEQAFFILVLAPEFYLPLRMLGTRFHAGMSGVAAAKRIFQILETPLPESQTLTPENQALMPAATWPEWATDGLPAICLDSVSFTYPDQTASETPGSPAALQQVTFEIEPGQKVALVGSSGSGKSTLAALLLRFIEPGAGSIRVGGRSLNTIPLDAWREQVAWVPQNPYLFHETVAANIRLARPGASQAEIEAAARQAHAHDFISELPQGYETLVGERGLSLSGGQAQRIALARAFLKDSPFLILDEATAHLDPELEALLQDAVDHLLKGRTALVIAHRLNTVQAADRILVLDNGRVVEQGTHAALMQAGRLYRQLVNAYEGAA